MALEDHEKDVFKTYIVGRRGGENTCEGNSLMHARVSQEVGKHENLEAKKCPSLAIIKDEKLTKPEPVGQEDFSPVSKLTSSATEKFKAHKTTSKCNQPIQLKHQTHDSTRCMRDEVEDIKDNKHLAAQANTSEATSRLIESNEKTCEVLKFNSNDVIEASKKSQETLNELYKSKHMQMKAPPATMNLYQYLTFANAMSVGQDKKNLTLSSKCPGNDTESGNNDNIERYRCATPVKSTTRTSSLSEDKVPGERLQSSREPNKPPFGDPSGDLASGKSRPKNDMEESQGASIALGTRSAIKPDARLTVLSTQNADNVAMLKGTSENKKILEHAPTTELMPPQGLPIVASMPPYLHSGIALTQADEERPGAYAVMLSGSELETVRLPSSLESWSGCHGFDEESQRNLTYNYHAQGPQDEEATIDEGHMATNENNPLEAHMVEDERALFAEVVVWYKRPLYRWILVVVVILVAAIIALGVLLKTGATAQELARTPDEESIACFFLFLSQDECRKTTRVVLPERRRSHSTIPTELGVLTQLTYLSLSENKLNGTIPSEIGALTNLLSLNLDKNELTGTIPSEIWALTMLNSLDLDENQLFGIIPSELGALNHLAFLDVSDNQLTGVIPWDLKAMTNLTTLDLSINSLSGIIPPEMAMLPNLIFWDLSENKLKGTIHSEIGAQISLTTLNLFLNKLTGTIPSELGGLTRLATLDLSLNSLTGTIPSEMGTLTASTTLKLYTNQLNGPIPSELGLLTSLTTLYLYSNKLTGTIPSELGVLTRLTTLYLYSNELNGAIPSELGVLTLLTSLNVYSSQLAGTIPSELGTLTSLTTLNLYLNQLTGTIPSEMGILTSLTTLNYYSNQLIGTIPSEIGGLTNLTTLDLSVNWLNGTIPSELGVLSTLTTLKVFSNQLTGIIPSEMGAMTSLSTLYLDNNHLFGSIPNELSNLNDTWLIRLHNNSLSGTIPTELCQPGANISIDCGEIECSCCNSFDGKEMTPCF